jgi:hypothetical protein
LGRPLACPAGSVRVAPGQGLSLVGNTSYCFAAGTYTTFQLVPQNGDQFYGQGKAVLDGGNRIASAFAGAVSGTTIDGFTMRHYATAVKYQSPAVIDIFSGSGDEVSDNTIGPDSATAIRFGDAATCCGAQTSGSGVDSSTITHNVIQDVGYSGTVVVGGNRVVVSYNDVSHTNLFDSDTEDDVAALGKFANDNNTVAVGNWVHDNNDTAVWFDVFDYNVSIENNRIGPNNRVGISYELSYNATISGNLIEQNGATDAGQGLSAPGAGIRVSAAGYSPIDPGPHGIVVMNNRLVDNYEGIVLYDGHGPSLPVNHTVVTGNTITSTDAGADAWDAFTAEAGRGNSFSHNTYSVSNDLFADPAASSWGDWRRSGFDRYSTCTTTLGIAC